MLSAFSARPLIELRARDKSKIETILAYGDRVLVGLNHGALRIYRVNEISSTNNNNNNNNNTHSNTNADANVETKPKIKLTDLLREIDRFSSRAIEQLAIVKEANTLVSLSNYHISLHNLQSYELIETLSASKNATCFAVTSGIDHDESGIPEIISRLAVVVKRRLLLWSWQESELNHQFQEVTLAEPIRTLTWANKTTIICGMNSVYAAVDVKTLAVKDIAGSGLMGTGASGQMGRLGAVGSVGMGYMGLGYTPKPLATKLSNGELLLARDVNTMFVSEEGTAKNKAQIPWHAPPESIGYFYPYVVALQSPQKGILEVRNPETLTLLQSLSLPGASQLHFPPSTVSLAHATKGFHVVSERSVWKMEATDYDAQIEELVQGGHFDEAISVLNMLEHDALLRDKSGTLRETKMLKAEMLFRQKKYRASMDLFNDESVQAPPERVLRLFPPSISGELSAIPEEGTGDQEGGREATVADSQESKTSTDGTSTHEIPEPEPPKAVSSATGAPPSSDTPDGKTSTVSDLAATLAGHRSSSPSAFARLFMSRNTAVETSSVGPSSLPPPTEHEGSEAGQSQHSGQSSFDGVLEGKDLMNAVLELNSYLAGARTRLQRVLDPTSGKLKSNLDQSFEEVLDRLMDKPAKGTDASFCSKTPSSNEEELGRTLRETFTLVDTSLFRAYMFSRPTLAGSLFRIPNFCDPDVVNEKLIEHGRYMELVEFLYGKKLHAQALELLKRFGMAESPNESCPMLHGPQRTIRYLQNLSPENAGLIFEFAEWTLRANPRLAMEIFVTDTENAETLPREKVLDFLAGIDTLLETQYLEHIIEQLHDLTPDFHNRLVALFVEHLTGGHLEHRDEATARETAQKSAKDRDNNNDDSEMLESIVDNTWEGMMERFIRFLKESRQYSLSRAFALIPRNDDRFYEAQIAVLRLMGNHKQALEIYVFRMHDYTKAEAYCHDVFRETTSTEMTLVQDSVEVSGEPQNDSIYHTLLGIYLRPPAPHRVNLEPAIELLSRNGARLPALSTLDLIPTDLPLSSLVQYFQGRIRATNSSLYESRILAGLQATQYIASQAALLLGSPYAPPPPTMEAMPASASSPTSALSASRTPSTVALGGRSRHVVITEERLCGICHKRLGKSVISVLPDNTAIHSGCAHRGPSAERRTVTRAASWGRLA